MSCLTDIKHPQRCSELTCSNPIIEARWLESISKLGRLGFTHQLQAHKSLSTCT